MKKATLFLLLAGTTAVTALSRAQEAPPPPPHGDHAPGHHQLKETARFHEEMMQLNRAAMEKAAALEAEGKMDEAAEVRAHAGKKQQAAIEAHHRTLQEKSRARAQKERTEKIKRAARERAEKRERQQAEPRPDRQPPADHHYGSHGPDRKRRLHHIEQAIKHLHEAGMVAPARNLERLADRLRQSGLDRPAPPRARHREPAARPEELESLRQELRALKKEVEEWRSQRAENTPAPATGAAPEKHH